MNKNSFHVIKKFRVDFDNFKNHVEDLYSQNHIQTQILVYLNRIFELIIFDNTLKKRFKN